MNLFLQVLSTEEGLSSSYRPVFANLTNNLKRRMTWNSLEVHAIYAFVYTLCTNLKGISEFRKFLGSDDPQVLDPVFIAQYLLVPVNTIVKTSLLPWMMKTHEALKLKPSAKNKY